MASEEDFDTHYVPLLQEYTLKLSELEEEVERGEKGSSSRLTVWSKVNKMISVMSSSFLQLVVTKHEDLVELIMNNLSIDTYLRSEKEWTYCCTCLQVLLRGTGENFWKIISMTVMDVMDDIFEVLYSLLPVEAQHSPDGLQSKSTASTPYSSSSSVSYTSLATAFQLLSVLVETSVMSLKHIKLALHYIEEILSLKRPAPTMTLDSGCELVARAISEFTKEFIEKEHHSLITINLISTHSVSQTDQFFLKNHLEIIRNCSYFVCQLSDQVTTALSLESSMDTFQIQLSLLDSCKTIGLISEDYIKVTDSSIEIDDCKILTVITKQHRCLGNLIASMMVKIENTEDRPSESLSNLRIILSHIPYCLVCHDSHLKSTALALFKVLVETITKRCCHSRSWANPMQVLDPLIEDESFLTLSKAGNSFILQCTSSNAFKIVIDACSHMSDYIEKTISTLQCCNIAHGTLKSCSNEAVAFHWQGHDRSTLSTGPSQVRSSVQKYQLYLPEQVLNKLFCTAIAAVFSFYERLRVILHTVYLHIGSVIDKNSHRSVTLTYSIVSWQELWCVALPLWEEKLQSFKLRRGLFKNGIVPEVSTLPVAPHLVNKPTPVIDISRSDVEENSHDPLLGYVKEISTCSKKDGTLDKAPQHVLKSSPHMSDGCGRPEKVGMIRRRQDLKASDTGNNGNSALCVPSASATTLSRAKIVKLNAPIKPSDRKSTKKSTHKGGAGALKQLLKEREEEALMENRCGGIDDYFVDNFSDEKAVFDESRSSSNYCPQPFYPTKREVFHRTSGLIGFDDLRRKSKKRGSEAVERADDPAKSTFTFATDALDTFGEFKSASTLDDGDEFNTNELSLQNEVMAKSKSKTASSVPDITTLLGEYSTSGKQKKSVTQEQLVANKFELTLREEKPSLISQKSIEDTNLTMTQKLAQVNIDDFYLRLLRLSLGKSLPDKGDLDKCPVRFVNEEKYIKLFQPLLEAELDAMLSQVVASNGTHLRTNEKMLDASAKSMKLESPTPSASFVLPKIYVRCALIQPRTVASVMKLDANSSSVHKSGGKDINHASSTYSTAPSSASSYLEEVRVAVVSNPNLNTSKYNGNEKLSRDDLVVVLDSMIVHGGNAVDINTCLLKDLLGLPHCLAVVVSQHSSKAVNPSGIGGRDSGGEEFDQQTLVMLKDESPPTTSTWICVPFVSLTTHTREWKALHSIRSHGLLPLVPYLLKAAPVVSASRLQSIYRQLEKGISSIVQTKSYANDQTDLGRQICSKNSTRASIVLNQLTRLRYVNTDYSVLQVTNMPEKLRSLSKRKGLEDYPEILSALKDIRAQWKAGVKHSNRDSTIRDLKGGNVVTASTFGETRTLQEPPEAVPPPLWSVLSKCHNETQLFAIKYVVSAMKMDKDEDDNDTRICLIQGPPGTGKTRTILAMVSTLLHLQPKTLPNDSSTNDSSGTQSKSNRILVCAPSNAAVDEVLHRLLKDGVVNKDGKIKKPKLVRLGKPLEGCTNEIGDLMLENQVEKLVQRDPAWKKLQKALESTSSLKMKLKSGSIEMESRRRLRSELRLAHSAKISAELQISLRRTAFRRILLESCDVLAGTLSAMGQYSVLDHVKQYDIRFETVLIDEAAQATEPSTLIPLRYGCKTLVLVGDPRQLPAYVASHAAEKAGLGKSLFERLEQAGHAVVMLSVQYRMHPRISAFPSKQFYNGKLRDAHRIQVECAEIDKDDKEVNSDKILSKRKIKSRVTSPLCRHGSSMHFSPVTLFDMQGREEAVGKSFRNRTEADFIFSLLDSLSSVPCMRSYRIGILSPYKGQVNLLQSYMSAKANAYSTSPIYMKLAELLDIEVNTIDGFQGREKDFILLSTVRSNPRGVGFLSNERRLNVAITRAKKCLLIVGCSNTLQLDTVWSNYLKMLRETDAIKKCPSTGKFEDYEQYDGIMSTARELVEGSACPSLDHGGISTKSSGAQLVDSRNETVLMKRTLDMIQTRYAADRSSARRLSTLDSSIAHHQDNNSSLEDGEVEEDESVKSTAKNLIGKKKRI